MDPILPSMTNKSVHRGGDAGRLTVLKGVLIEIVTVFLNHCSYCSNTWARMIQRDVVHVSSSLKKSPGQGGPFIR